MARNARGRIEDSDEESPLGEQLHALRMKALPSEWAIANRRIPDTFTHDVKPWSFKGREWQRAIHDDLSTRIVVEKAAQMGLTEVAMNRAMHALDALGKPVLYLFPTKEDSGDFSQSRFEPMLDMSPRLRRLFTDVSNVGLKRAGAVSMYFRGSNSSSGLKSIPVAYLVIDEFEEMVEASVALARKRLIGHADWGEFNLSTPKSPGAGIDEEFQKTDQLAWYVPCPHCGERQELEIGANLDIPDSGHVGAFWKCSECDEPWSEQQRLELIDLGEWKANNPGAGERGYHISQLYSPVATAERIAREWHEAQESATKLQEFYNSFLGRPYSPKGLKITEALVKDCMGSKPMVQSVDQNTFTAMGADIGLTNDFVIGRVENGIPRILHMGSTDWDGLSLAMQMFNVDLAVVDAAPERHMAHMFRETFSGQVWLAFYPGAENMSGLEVRWNDENETVDIHRTAVADRVVTRFAKKGYALPGDTPRRFVRHMLAVYRSLEASPTTGSEKAVWKHRGPDHFFHAMVYLSTAMERLFDDDIGLELNDEAGSDAAWGDSPGRETGTGMEWMTWGI